MKLRLSGTLGILVAFCSLLVLTVPGGSVTHFINIPSIVFVTCVALGLQLATVGGTALSDLSLGLRLLFFESPSSALRAGLATDLRAFARYLYVAGVIGTIIGLIQMLANFHDWSSLSFALVTMALTPFYATILAECIVRPCANRIDYLVMRDNDVV
jgi:flagellar motor component MotA